MPTFIEALIIFFAVVFGVLFYAWGFIKILTRFCSKKEETKEEKELKLLHKENAKLKRNIEQLLKKLGDK